MALNIDLEVTALQRLTVGQLQTRYAELFGEPPRGRHRVWLVRRIAWRRQALAEGDLSARARQRSRELANDADLRLTPSPIRKRASAVTVNGHGAADRELVTTRPTYQQLASFARPARRASALGLAVPGSPAGSRFRPAEIVEFLPFRP
jgi:hypothetical protein